MTHNNDLPKYLDKLEVNKSKQTEIQKNKTISDVLCYLFTNFEPHKLHLTVANKIPKKLISNNNLHILGNLIQNNIVTHERIMNAAFDYLLENKTDNIEKHLEKHLEKYNITDTEITEIIKNCKINEMNRKDAYKTVQKHEILKYCSSLQISRIIEDMCNEKESEVKKTIDDEYTWLREGELSKIHTPETNPLNDKKTLLEYLNVTGSKVITRFPPEPNGFLHIGHAKALNLSFEFSKMHNGEFILRFDDTNPKNEKEECYESIKSDVEWLLNTKIEKVTYASDYFDELIDFGYKLIEKDKAYVCHLPQEDIKKYRELMLDSPYRNRDSNINKAIFTEMTQGLWKEGTACLRLKMDMQNKNPLMHDLVAFRIIEQEHFRTKNKYKVYPSYDFTHCINDSLENITHSFCSREFFLRRETYYWLLDELNLYKPVQWEFSRLNIQDTVLSKRKILELINNKVVTGWDDPRIYTLCGLRRRGFTPKSINNFVKSVGITFNDSVIERKALEKCVREDLMIVSSKLSCIIDPVKVIIENKKEIYIDKSDFCTVNNDNFMRLTPEQPVGLLNYIAVEFVSFDGDTIIVKETQKTPKKYIHWVDANANKKVELRLYSELFVDDKLNSNSLVVKQGICEVDIQNYKIGDNIQFRRVGFFCIDKDTTKDNFVLNLTLPLKNATWK
ncbi:Glutaminyl-tRNA synthetase [Binucleata daphniae]